MKEIITDTGRGKITPLPDVCLYIPRERKLSFGNAHAGDSGSGGRGPQVTSVTPPGKDGKIDAVTLAAAYCRGWGNLPGGRHAGCAAVAYGTETIPAAANSGSQ